MLTELSGWGFRRDPVPQFDRFMPARIKQAPVGSIFEWRNDLHVLDIARRVRDRGAALIIDYGHAESGIGETLQSVNEHAFADPLSAPGLADITAHVDFEIFGQAAESMGAMVQGPVTQGRFLSELGIEARAEALRKGASGEQAANITAAVARLTESGRTGMGDLFKVMAICDPKLGPTSRATADMMLQAKSLSSLDGISHGFFTRAGGVSDGIYASLNGGVGSKDDAQRVGENRARMARALRRGTGKFRHLLSNSFAGCSCRRKAVDAGGASEGGCHRYKSVRPCHRRFYRRLRATFVRR